MVSMSAVNGYDYDLVIIGAGLSGLSLACWLMDLADQQGRALPSVCLLEPRTHYENDRTWCFWDTGPNSFGHLIAHRWQHWQVRSGNRAFTQTSVAAPYAMLAAGDVYHYAQQRIQACPSVTLQCGVRVDEVRECPNGVEVTSTRGPCFARAVVDTRPPTFDRHRTDIGFWQVFAGAEVHYPGHGFDSRTATLMDFQSSDDRVCFVYVLPFDNDRLLVEWTEFDPNGSVSHCREKLADWLQAGQLAGGEVVRTESGALPMFSIDPGHKSSRLLKAGVAAGWMRPATGYHFATCQRTSRRLAEKILVATEEGHWSLDNTAPRAHWLGWMDSVFLRAMRDNPIDAPDWFLAMFQHTNGGQMARFMNDQPRFSDALSIIMSLPKAPFLKALFRA